MWQKRKCSVKNGFLTISHGTVSICLQYFMYMVANTERQAVLVYIYDLELARFLMQCFECEGYIFLRQPFRNISRHTQYLKIQLF